MIAVISADEVPMAYFLNRESREIRVAAPGVLLHYRFIEIPTDKALAHSLVDREILSVERANSLLSEIGSTDRFSTASLKPVSLPPPSNGVTSSTLEVVKSAARIAFIVEIIAWILGVGSVIAGLLIATITRDFDEGFGLSDVQHPFLATGVALAVGGLFQCLIIVMVARYIRARMLLAQER